MSVITTGTPVVSAVIRTRTADGVSATLLARDDEITSLTLTGYPKDIVIESATVRGFTLKSLQLPRNTCCVFDGIPAYKYENDDEPSGFFHLAEETTQVDKVVVEIAPESEDEDPIVMSIPVGKIKSFDGGTAVETPESGSADAGAEEDGD